MYNPLLVLLLKLEYIYCCKITFHVKLAMLIAQCNG